MNGYPRTPDNPRVPLPFVPQPPRPGETLAQHVGNKDDPHETLKRAKQVRILAFLPGDLSQFNDGDLVIVYTTGLCYRVIADGDSRGLEALNLHYVAPLAGKTFNLRTDDDKTFALGSIIEALGGQARV